MRPPHVIGYRFRFSDGSVREVQAQLEHDSLALANPPEGPPPEWTRLGFRQCTNCPLSEAASPRCPIAANLAEVIDVFRDRVSWERVDVDVHVYGRTYYKAGPLQEGLSSLIGIFTVTSGCPVLDRLRPMVATHVPFMTTEESTYRVVAMYLMAQHFVVEDGGDADWKLEGLVEFLEQVRLANQGLSERFGALGMKDACANAISTLNARGEIAGMAIVEEGLARWGRIFRRSVLGKDVE